MIKKKILFITGTRADYGKLKPLMLAVEQSDIFECYIFVSGMHLLNEFGSTYNEIIKDSYKNIHIAMNIDVTGSMSTTLANTVYYLTDYVKEIMPDMIVVHGDRLEALAGAIVGAFNNIIVSHIEGGEVSGTIDESIRHSISKFAHIHFACNDEAAQRLIQLGEMKENIYVIGSPDIDIMMSDSLPSVESAKEWYKIGFEEYSILMYHPVTTEFNLIEKNISKLVSAAKSSEKNYIVIYPNNDLGHQIILDEYEKLKGNARFAIFPSLRFEYFLVLLKHADFIIGNSSAGVREASLYGVPVIDVGTRQQGRYRLSSSLNILHSNEDAEEIQSAIKSVNEYRKVSSNFGRGNSKDLFMDILENKDVWEIDLQKRFIDFNEIML